MSNDGKWDSPLESALKIVGVHAVVLYTGKVLYWCFDSRAVGLLNVDNDKFTSLFNDPNLGSYQLWDPSTGKAGLVQPIGRNAFCGGQCTLADGTVFVAGGQDQYGAIENFDLFNSAVAWLNAVVGGSDEGALKDVHTYDPVADTWTRWPDLHDGRYYPTCLVLDEGTAFVAGGLSNLQRWVLSGGNWCENDQFETLSPGYLAFPGPSKKFMSADQYPIIRLLPGSRMLFVHIETTTYLFDLDSASFVQGAQFMPPGVGRQTYPMQSGHVLLPLKEGDPPRILIVGGSTATGFDYNTHSDAPAVQDAFIFDFNAASPEKSSWRTTAGKPNSKRILDDTVLLPDGTVFVVNGVSKGAAAGHTDQGPAPIGTAEIFDPVSETFTQVASPSAQHPRGYHATAVLLPDARVAIAGNTKSYNPGEAAPTDDVSIEVYSPPYLSAGPRPSIPSNIPTSLPYASTLTVDNSSSPTIDQVMMMRPCAVTHTVDMDQRAIWLKTKPGASAGTLDLAIPSDRSLAPPGPYMLFFLAKGVPSLGAFVFVGVPAPSSFKSGNGGGNGGSYPPLNLGTREGSSSSAEAYDGDLTLEKIDNGYTLTLESRHGSITINEKIDQHSWAKLTAHTTFSLGQTVDQHSTATIVAQGDITIGLKINATSQAWLTSVNGKVDIGQKVDDHSSAIIKAGTTVHIGQKIDQHSTVHIIAQGDVGIDQGINQHCTVDITSVNGSIHLGRDGDNSVDNQCDVTLTASNGSITLDGKVAGGSTVKQHAGAGFNCPGTDGGGTITAV